MISQDLKNLKNNILYGHRNNTLGWMGGNAFISFPQSNWDYDMDFSTDDGKWAFATGSATNEIDTGASKLDFDMIGTSDGGTNYSSAGDLISGVVSDTAWYLRLHAFRLSTNSTAEYLHFGMFDSNQATNASRKSSAGVNEDGLFYSTYNNASPDTNYAGYRNAQNFDTQTLGTSTDQDWSTATDYYIEQIRLSATSFQVKRGLNSDFTSPQVNITNTVSSAVINLRYFKFENLIYTGFGGQWTGTLDRLQFENGATTPP